MNKSKLIAVALIIGTLVIILGLFTYFLGSPVLAVQSGEKTLMCEFEDGLRKVPGDMVLYEKDGFWKFKNGSANSCFLTD